MIHFYNKHMRACFVLWGLLLSLATLLMGAYAPVRPSVRAIRNAPTVVSHQSIQEPSYEGAFYAQGKRIMLAYSGDYKGPPIPNVNLTRARREYIDLWDIKTHKFLALVRGPEREPDSDEVSHNFLPTCAAITANGTQAFMGGQGIGAFLAFDVPHKQVLSIWGGGNIEDVNGLVVSPNGKYLLLAESDRVELRNVATGELVRVLRQVPTVDGSYNDAIGSIGFSSDGKYVVTTFQVDDSILLSEVQSGSVIRQLHCASVGQVLFSPDDRYLLTLSCPSGKLNEGCETNLVRLWEWRTGKLVREFKLSSENMWQRQVEFTPDGKYLVANGGQISVWNVWTGAEVRRFPKNRLNGAFGKVHVSPDGKYVLSAKWDVGLWQLATGKPVRFP